MEIEEFQLKQKSLSQDLSSDPDPLHLVYFRFSAVFAFEYELRSRKSKKPRNATTSILITILYKETAFE